MKKYLNEGNISAFPRKNKPTKKILNQNTFISYKAVGLFPTSGKEGGRGEREGGRKRTRGRKQVETFMSNIKL